MPGHAAGHFHGVKMGSMGNLFASCDGKSSDSSGRNRGGLALRTSHVILSMGDRPAIGRVGRIARRRSLAVVHAAAARIGLKDADMINVIGRVFRSRQVPGFQRSAQFVVTDPLRGMTARVGLFFGFADRLSRIVAGCS